MSTPTRSITVQRTIDAPAKDIFEDPVRTGAARRPRRLWVCPLRRALTHRITANGQTFRMNMTGPHMGGDYQTDNH